MSDARDWIELESQAQIYDVLNLHLKLRCDSWRHGSISKALAVQA